MDRCEWTDEEKPRGEGGTKKRGSIQKPKRRGKISSLDVRKQEGAGETECLGEKAKCGGGLALEASRGSQNL